MKAVKAIIAFVIAVPLIFVAVGMVLPNETHLERSIQIDAEIGTVFSLVGNHHEFQRWSPWSKLDPNMTVTISGPGYGLGSEMAWSGNEKVGTGTSTFIEYTPNSRAVTLLDFGEMGNGTAAYDLIEKDGGTFLTWGFDTSHDGLISRYFGLMMDSMLGPVYEDGLASLKSLAESIPQVQTEEVSYDIEGTIFKGYLAYPRGSLDPVPGVLVVHEWWGHNDYARKRATMLAEQGYAALALDMYGDGKLAQHPEDAMTFMQEVGANTETTEARFDAAMDLLKNHSATDGTRIAAIGYCFGGAVVLNMARSGKNLLGVASFHGGLGDLAPISENVIAPMLVLNGQADPFVLPEHVEKFKKEMDEASLAYEFVDYPGVKHSFTNPDADSFGQKFELPLEYDESADKDSWRRLEAFLQKVFY